MTSTGSTSWPGPTLRHALTERRFYLLILATAAVWYSTIAMLRDSTGSYLAGIDLMMGLLLLAFVCVMILKPARSESTLADISTGD